jgi:hypothetical protein
MRIIILSIILLFTFSIHAQSFTGNGDKKFQIGANFQNNATGIIATYDQGIGQNISVGLKSTYALGINNDIDASFSDRFDVRARFNANIGNVLNIDNNFDFYPGLSLGLKNFGGHLGARYFFSAGFGVFSEIGFPIARYNTDDLTPAEKINNQFNLNIGLIFSVN